MLNASYPLNPLLFQLGLPADLLARQAAAVPAFALPSLHQAYQDAFAGITPPSPALIPPFLMMPNPAAAMPLSRQISGAGYASSPRMRMDLANYVGADKAVGEGFWARLLHPQRRAAAKLERLLQSDDMLRSQFEQAIGGRIVDFGSKSDGKIAIQRFESAGQALPLVSTNAAANEVNQLLQGLQSGTLQQAQALGMLGGTVSPFNAFGTTNPFLALALGGLASVASSLLMGNGAGGMGGALGSLPFAFNMLNGAGVGSWNPLAAPGHINNTNPAYENAHQAQVASVLNDPSLSVEDKVMLMLALIMKKMDDDIERQMQYINALQNQQANRGKKGGKGGGGQASPSVDVEMQKLQRMITKRAQLFEMASNIMKKYDDTARAAIQKMNS